MVELKLKLKLMLKMRGLVGGRVRVGGVGWWEVRVRVVVREGGLRLNG